ncbi:lamin tail domain-containing protein [Candidatus Saccharibacteria bacterium]|nr:lamin tail domain-containing protein [Candidatus Saccharibacteria bacterium]
MKKLRYLNLAICLTFLGGILSPSFSVFAEELQGSDVDWSAEENSENFEENSEENLTENPEEDVPEEEPGIPGNVVLKSFNPGFSDEGEFLELGKLSETSLSLAGLSVIYVTSTGREYTVFDFLEGYTMVGESLLMRLASSSEVQEAEDFHEVADLTYTRNMSQSKGKIKLLFEEEVIDSICWGLDEDGCFPAFNSRTPTTLVRNFSAEEVEDLFVHTENYVPTFNPEEPGLLIEEIPEEVIEPKCRSLEFSEILTYFETSSSEQFIEFFNRSEEPAEISGCFLRYKNHNYPLSGEVTANGFKTFYPAAEWNLTLTKNPTSTNTLEIIDADGEVVDSLRYSTGQRKGVALAMVGFRSDGSENWVQTFSPTPNAENFYQQFRTCPIGKVINLETGNCVNETSLTSTLAACPEGKYRNPLTGRCKSYATTASATLKPCAEGYERNPATGRCRKIVTNDGADYELKTETFEEKSEFVAIWAIVAIIVVGLIYILFQYKDEIQEKLRK